MAGGSSDYHRGGMDIAEQSSTYALVMNMTKWGSLVVAVSVLFFVLLFCTGAGFMGAAVTALVVAVLGTLFLRGGGEASAH
jgi:hypothetical protein